jgi:hypothetical protein
MTCEIVRVIHHAESLARPVARSRLCNYARPTLLGEVAAELSAVRHPHDALIEPRLLLEVATSLAEGEWLALGFTHRDKGWRFAIDIACRRPNAGCAQALLENLLCVAAPTATFKNVEADDAPAQYAVNIMSCADALVGEGTNLIWLPPEPFVAPDLRRALAAALAFGVSQIRFVVRSLTLTPRDRTELETARFRLQAATTATESSRLGLLNRWMDAGRGTAFEIELKSAQPLGRDALNIMRAALFGRAASAPVGAPSLDLRGAVPAGRLPSFRFWPTASDFARRSREPQASIPSAPGNVTIGRDAADDFIRLAAEDRSKHLMVLGSTGVGKSTLILNMLREDIANGEGGMLIDPHGDLADEVRASMPANRRDDLVWIDVGDEKLSWRLDLLTVRGANPAVERSRVANQFVSLFRQMYASVPEALGPCFEQYFRASLLLLMEARDPADRALTRFEDVLVDESFRHKLLRECTDAKVRQFWEDTAAHVRGDYSLENIAPYITNKMAQISSNPLTAQLVAGDQAVVDLRAAMDQRKVVLVRLSKGVIGDYEARFLGSLFLMSLAEAALSRARTPVSERTPFRVYIDEFQTMATQSAADMLAECRKYGLCLTLANQSLSQLVGDKFNPASVGQAALANCASFALFRMGLADAAIMAATIDGLSASELTHLNVGEMVIRRLSGGTPLAAEWVFGLPPPTARSIGPLR